MKNVFFLTAIGFTIAAVPAYAVQKCVALDSSTTCTSSTRPTKGTADWSLSCTTSGTTVAISGIGMCSNTEGTISSPTSTLTITAISYATEPGTCYVGDATYCYCKMLSPAVSYWTYSGIGYSTESDCLYNCAYDCATYITRESALRTALFGNLGD